MSSPVLANISNNNFATHNIVNTMICNHALLFSLVLFSTARNAGVLAGNQEHGLLDQLANFRFKRGSRMMDDHCVQNCFSASPIPVPVGNFFKEVVDEVFRREKTTNIQRIFNVTMLKWHCEYGNQRQQCVSKCSNESPYKQEMLEVLRPTTYICNESDIINNTECYRQVYEQDLDNCDSWDKCLPYKKVVKNLLLGRYEDEMDGISLDERNVQIFFRNLCQYIICGNQCRSKEIISRCGRESNEILLNFYSRVVASVKMLFSLLYYQFTDMKLIFQDTCNQISL